MREKLTDFQKEEVLLGEREVVAMEGWMDILKRDGEKILRDYPVEGMERAIKARLDREKRAGLLRFTGLAFPALAAAALAVSVLSPTLLPTGSPLAWERLKGDNTSLLHVYRHLNGTAERLSEATLLKNGDTIQISYSSGGAKYGAVLSVDGRSALTVHLSDGDRAAALKRENETPLPFAYELDNAPRFETFVFLFSDKPFDLRAWKNKMTAQPQAFQKGQGREGGVFWTSLTVLKENNP